MSERSILQGIKVVEVATFVFGPAAATVMADFGADVVKIEQPGIGDPYRLLKELPPLPECEANYCWLLDGRGKRSVAVDLKTEAGRAIVVELVRGADVFLTNYHPSVLADLRLRWEDLALENDRLVYAHATGYGEEGPDVEKPGYDATAWWARSGLMDAVRSGGADPGIATPGMGDHPSAMAVFGGILLALFDRERTGRGTKVSTSLMANGLWSNSIFVQAALCGAKPYVPRPRNDAPNALVHFYTTRDGRMFYLALVNERNEWSQFCAAIERPELIEDERFAELEIRRSNAAALIALLDEVFAARELSAWEALFVEHGITYSPIASTWDVPDDPQAAANGMLPAVDGGGGLRTVANPLTVLGGAKRTPTLAPSVGAHTEQVLAELGYDAGRIEALVAEGVVQRDAGEG